MVKLSKSNRRTLKAIFGAHLSDDQLWTAHLAFVESMLDELVDDQAVVRIGDDEYALKPELVH